jgi:hypothetical protein
VSSRERSACPKVCGHADCAISTGIHEGLTFGRGTLDFNGYWQIPCEPCARAWEAAHPGEECWPLPADPAEEA